LKEKQSLKTGIPTVGWRLSYKAQKQIGDSEQNNG
jgi:hypothetical protein